MARYVLATLAVAASLAACNPPSQTLLTQAQTVALQTCSFLPTADTIASIVAQGNAAISTAEQIGNAVCAAIRGSGVAPTPATALLDATPPPGTPKPQVLGVQVHGRFVGG